MKHEIKKITAAAAACILMFPGIPAKAEEEGNKEFDEFLMDVFAETVESDYLSMHYTVRDYESMGLARPEATLGDIDFEENTDLQDYLDELHAFDYESLSKTQQHDYIILERDLELSIESEKYAEDYTELFSPVDGVTEALITNFTEYFFYTKQDIDDYLTLIEETPDYLEQALEATRSQASRGHFLTDNALDQLKESIDKFTSETEKNPLVVDFATDINAMEGLSDQEKQDYISRNEDLILNHYIPAYKHVAEELEKLRGSRSVSGGLCEFEDGADYYRVFLAQETSSSKTPEELMSLCEKIVLNEIFGLATLGYEDNGEQFKLDDAEETLNYLAGKLDDYPEGANTEFTVSNLDPSITNPNIVAYYLTPCIDATDVNVIRVNESAINDTNDLYMTLSHEGFPGHQYQVTWFLNTDPSPVRSVLSHGGYTEGWAMYTELYQLDHSGMSPEQCAYLKAMTVIGYMAPCVIDIGVNMLGWSVSDVGDELDKMYLNREIAQDLYNEAVDTPGRLLNYGCGLAQFLSLRYRAEDTLGDDFDPVEYNRVLLTYGDRDFEVVESDLNEWVKILKNGEELSGDSMDLVPYDIINNGEYSKNNLKYGLYAIGGFAIAAVLVIFFIIRAKKKNPFSA